MKYEYYPYNYTGFMIQLLKRTAQFHYFNAKLFMYPKYASKSSVICNNIYVILVHDKVILSIPFKIFLESTECQVLKFSTISSITIHMLKNSLTNSVVS